MPLPLVNSQVRSCDTTCVPACVPAWVPDCVPAWVPACVPDCVTLWVSDWDVGCCGGEHEALGVDGLLERRVVVAECGLDVALADEALAVGVDGDAGVGGRRNCERHERGAEMISLRIYFPLGFEAITVIA